MEIKQLYFYAEERLKSARNIERLIRTRDFITLFNCCCEKEQYNALQIIQKMDIVQLKEWTTEQRRIQARYFTMTVKQLRELGRSRRIPEYQYMKKYDLILELQDRDAKEFE